MKDISFGSTFLDGYANYTMAYQRYENLKYMKLMDKTKYFPWMSKENTKLFHWMSNSSDLHQFLVRVKFRIKAWLQKMKFFLSNPESFRRCEAMDGWSPDKNGK